jgi:hypothetical protein
MHKIFYKEKQSTGLRNIYFFGVKIFSYRNKKKNVYYCLSQKDIEAIQSNYKVIEEKLKNKIKNGQKINVVFGIGIPSMFPAKMIMQEMSKDKNFNVTLIVIPDFRFGMDHCHENLKKSYQEYFKTFNGNILMSSANPEEDTINLKEIADIIFLPLPYDVSHSKYNLLNIIKNEILPVFINYSNYNTKYDRNQLIASPVFSLFWKVFVDTKDNLEEFKKYSLIKGKNAVLTGYCKMDEFRNSLQNSAKKTIMISPHHSILGGFNDIMALSNFLKYSEFFLNLPNQYPNIDFIFRPHPALFPVLEKDKFWGKKKVDQYILDMKSKPNVIYSDYGNYFQDFANSDGIIQDCGSFLTEYFYTLKPQCYMLKDPSDIDEKFISIGKKCLENSYIAYNQDDIINFIENVIVKEVDVKKEQRENFAKNEVMLNYPNASSFAVRYIKECLK